ncbi:Na+/H+-exchanging protein [Microseira wollei NIES-4236]|uniref:Na+/H+-exchanging protein n=1 Tax=Microseira wollei NIES-4236 TaxID=2530354 RepID=A0AAV3XDY5_9CYAN|nr:Na+/H+-exchanging protein [Microseira wollei NIES-4236]
MLFTLLVQGFTIEPLLKKLQLLGDQPLRQRYLEITARQAALNRVLQYLAQREKPAGIEPEFYNYQESLIKGELARLEAEIKQLLLEYPNLRNFTAEQLKAELLAIEADTYAEFLRTGRLNKELAPFLSEELVESEKPS